MVPTYLQFVYSRVFERFLHRILQFLQIIRCDVAKCFGAFSVQPKCLLHWYTQPHPVLNRCKFFATFGGGDHDRGVQATM